MSNDLEWKLGKPQVVVQNFTIPMLGAKTGIHNGEQKLVLASYFEPAFIVCDVTFDDNGDYIDLELDDVISGEKSADFDGGQPKALWQQPADAHSAPRAATGQINRGWLFYLQNGGKEIGMYHMDTEKVDAQLTGIRREGRDFIHKNDGSFLVIEGGNNPWSLSEYRVSLPGQKLEQKDSINLGANLLYGLAIINNDILMVAPQGSNISDGPGLYKLVGGKLEKDDRVQNLHPEARSFAPVFNDNGELAGAFVTTYEFSRKNISQGTPSQLLFHPRKE